MTTTTTTVETLTAEVRALMIGRRQVTLSVYRQLDTAPWDDVEPFGRVRDGKDTAAGIYIVGRHRETGDLVRSSIDRDSWCADAPAEFAHWAHHNPQVATDRGKNSINGVATSHGRTLHWGFTYSRYDYLDGYVCTAPEFDEPSPKWPGPRDEYRGDDYRGDDYDADYRRYRAEEVAQKERREDHHRRVLSGEFCDMSGLEARWRALAAERVAELVPHELRYQAAEKLPLIVLAGLR